MSSDQMTDTRRAVTSTRQTLRGRGATDLPTTPRAYGQMAFAVLLLVVSGIVGAYLFTSAGDTTSVLAVKGPIAQGQEIERVDLVSKQVAGVEGAIAVADVGDVAGKSAKVALVPGQIVTGSMITSAPAPGGGLALVGLSLKSSQMPGGSIEPGDLVRAIAVPGDDVSAGVDLDKGVILSTSTQVYSVTGGKNGDGTQVVTVVAPEGDAERLTVYAAAGRVAILEISNAGGS